SLAPTELRAEKPDDVIYAGSGGRTPADFCEVELQFDNSSGLGAIEFSELSIARRLHRGGEGQYLVNRAPVRRIDLVELLAALGRGARCTRSSVRDASRRSSRHVRRSGGTSLKKPQGSVASNGASTAQS